MHVTFRLDEDMNDLLVADARASHMTPTALIDQIVRKYLSRLAVGYRPTSQLGHAAILSAAAALAIFGVAVMAAGGYGSHQVDPTGASGPDRVVYSSMGIGL